MSVLEDSVTQNEGGWDFECPNVVGSPCGVPGTDKPGFRSTGWPTKKAAMARGRQHFDEHLGLGVSQELNDFRTDNGIGVADNGTAVELEKL